MEVLKVLMSCDECDTEAIPVVIVGDDSEPGDTRYCYLCASCAIKAGALAAEAVGGKP